MTRTQVPVYLTPELLSYLDAVREDRSRSAFLAHLLKMHERATEVGRITDTYDDTPGVRVAARSRGH